jgi:integrase
MKRQFRFNKRSIEALPPCPPDARSKEIEYADTEVSGLRLQVNKVGRKAFLFRYQISGRKRAMKVGGYPETTIEEARTTAIAWKAMVAKGEDPQEARDDAKRTGMTYRSFFDDYLWPHIQSTKRSAKADASRYRGHILPALGDKELGKITTLELQRFHNDNKSKVAVATTNRIFELVRHSFTLAEQWGLLPLGSNPSRGIKLWKENNKRERYLSQEELIRFMKALQAERSQTAADYFRLLLATGARAAEAAKLQWSHLSMERQQWHLPIGKSGKGRVIILNEVAMDILRRRPRLNGNPYVFAGTKPGQSIGNTTRAWRRVLTRAGIDWRNLRRHDLRHTHASYLVEVASLHEIAGILGHANTATTQRYAHLNDQRLRQCSDHVASMMRTAAESR